MKNSLRYLASIVCCLLCFSCQPQKKTSIKKIDKATMQAEALGQDVQLVDVRTPEEYAKGHIGDAININVNASNFKEQISQMDKQAPIYLYCKMGGRSNRAVGILQELDFQTIYDYSGGYDDWTTTE
ncbi:rhodanese-like domain-containing protein [Flagellimonas algicola]|uniref:Rhodanese-like domain-containing protein n=1 Tax=Flagellimonas algicola TaxID=2583815 RepID=A0ABY2WJG6_9FLAO|nr:rhodanese-like domain-containing protein [Allomuricauda algicola]TMU54782.1 rhodanese-like domain-containing protein [Allomuricauda algicola]